MRLWDGHGSETDKPDHPVVSICWFQANAYCKWLAANWEHLPELRANLGLTPPQLRLPLETEWIAAAGGNNPEDRYPWDLPGKATTDENEIRKRANVAGGVGHITPVTKYPDGKSPFGVMDMSGNVYELQGNLINWKDLGLRGGAYHDPPYCARICYHIGSEPFVRDYYVGFRVVALPK